MAEAVLRLATRGSPLAIWQARRVADLMAGTGRRASLVVVETDGDRRRDVPIDRLGGQGVFVKEVQAAVVRGDADAAVHSAKDLPAAEADATGASGTAGATGLVLAAVPERADPRDLLVGSTLAAMSTGATVATGSARRRAQLANLRPDLTFTGLRGNLATRLAAAGRAGIAAVVVSKAAADRLEWRPPVGTETEVLGPRVMLPQVGQGALAVECRAGDEATRSVLEAIDDPLAGPLVAAERAYLAALGGGCTQPVGAHAVWATGPVPHGSAEGTLDGTPGRIELTAMIASADGRVVLRHTDSGTDPKALGRGVAGYLLDEAGGRELGEWPGGPGERSGAVVA